MKILDISQITMTKTPQQANINCQHTGKTPGCFENILAQKNIEKGAEFLAECCAFLQQSLSQNNIKPLDDSAQTDFYIIPINNSSIPQATVEKNMQASDCAKNTEIETPHQHNLVIQSNREPQQNSIQANLPTQNEQTIPQGLIVSKSTAPLSIKNINTTTNKQNTQIQQPINTEKPHLTFIDSFFARQANQQPIAEPSLESHQNVECIKEKPASSTNDIREKSEEESPFVPNNKTENAKLKPITNSQQTVKTIHKSITSENSNIQIVEYSPSAKETSIAHSRPTFSSTEIDFEKWLADSKISTRIIPNTPGQEIQLQLTHENENFQLTMTLEDNSVQLKLGTQQETMLEFLQNNVDDLKKQLIQKGFEVKEITFSNNLAKDFSPNSEQHKNNNFFQQHNFTKQKIKQALTQQLAETNEIHYGEKTVSYYI